MAKDKSSSKDKSKKEKKDKSLSKQSSDGITKPSKRDKPTSVTPENADRLLAEVANNAKTATVTASADADESMLDIGSASGKPQGALVPFANPLADDKVAKKVFKGVKKANKAKALKRGVKEVVKSLRKSPLATPSSMSSTTVPSGIVVIAADISPMDVISHLPVLCEDHGVPYVYVTSRAELGAAGQTKRPTSVVLVGREQGKQKNGKEGKDDDDKEEWSETFTELVKVVRKAGKDVRI